MGNGPSCLDEPCEDCPLLERMRQSLRRNVSVDNFSTNEVVGQEISGKKRFYFFLKQHYSVFFSFSLLTVRQFRTDLDIGGYKGGGCCAPPLGPSSFIFMQLKLRQKPCQMIGFSLQTQELAPPVKSWIRHCQIVSVRVQPNF